jgi:hypothetical protein
MYSPPVTAPQQLHLALAGAASAMTVAWATTVPVPDSIVWWWPYGARDPTSPTAPAALSVCLGGWMNKKWHSW